MITLQSHTHIDDVTGRQVFDFLLHCTDAEYQEWWPGTHLHLRTLKRRLGTVGNVVDMDEMVGSIHVRAVGVIREAVPGRRIVWQLRALVRLPVRLALDLEDDATGVTITHTIRAGFSGIGRILDALLRLYFSPTFARAMHEHVRIEFARLGERLRAQDGEVSTASAAAGRNRAPAG